MSQKVIRLVGENIMRLVAVDVAIDPKQPVVIIRGKNGNGKTSFIDLISLALGGKKIQPPEVIRRGQSFARVVLETEELIVERRWTKDEATDVVTDRLEVRSKDGAKFRSPQTMLDGLISRLSFDPLHFLQLEAKEQAEALRKIVGLDFRLLDGQRLKHYDDRTLANQQLDALTKRLAGMPAVKAPAAEVDVAALLADQALAHRQQAGHAELVHQSAAARVERERAEAAVKEAEARLGKLYAAQESARATEKLCAENLQRSPAPDPAKLAELATSIATASQVNENVRRARERAELEAKVAASTAVVKGLTDQIEAIDRQKFDAAEQAHFPVPGLGFARSGQSAHGAVTFNGLPFEQASGAEKIRVSTAVGFALNPELKTLRIKDGSLLDADSVALLEQLAREADGQVFLEVVSTEGVGILIEEGLVKSITDTDGKTHAPPTSTQPGAA